MESPARVSIIIPAYNYEGYIHSAVTSALNQTHPNVEVIVVDDGSTDRSPSILATFTDRITLIQQPNSGLAAARNRGIKEASGKFLFFLDADDLLTPEAIAKMFERMSEAPDGVMVACAFAYVDHQGTRLHNEPPIELENREIPLRELILKNRFSPAVLVDSETLRNQGGFDQDFGKAEMGSEDRDLWIRMATAGRVFMMSDQLVHKRQHESNMSSNPERQTASMKRTIQKCRANAIVPSSDFVFWARVHTIYHYQAGLMYREAHRRWRALKEFTLAFLRCPLPCPHKLAGLQPWFRTRALLVTLLAALRITDGLTWLRNWAYLLLRHTRHLGPIAGPMLAFRHKRLPAGTHFQAPQPHGQPVTLRARSSDLDVYEDTFIWKHYELPYPTKPKTIIDAGAHIGLASLQFAQRFPDATIIALEPHPENFALLKANVSHHQNIIPINAALWNERGTLSLANPDASTWSFQFQPNKDGEIQALSVPAILEEQNLDNIDLLKIDIEGAEQPLFASKTGWLQQVDTIVVELHDNLVPGCSQTFYQAATEFSHRAENQENILVSRLPLPSAD